MSNSWWRSLVKRKFTHGRPKPGSKLRGKSSRRLLLEYLESRLAPATHTWSGAGLSNNWSLDSNWTGGSPAGDTNAILLFPAAAAQLMNINDLNGQAVQSITFSANDYSISGNPITLSGGITVDGSVSGLVTFNVNTTLAATQTWTVTKAGASLAVRGDVAGSSTANFTKAGAGSLLLAGNNNYAGQTTVNSGMLVVSGGKAVGLGPVFFTDGSTLQADQTATITNNYTVSGAVVFSTKDSLSSLSLRGRGTINSFNSITVSNSPGDITFSGNLDGNGSLIVNPGSAGNVTVSGVANSSLTGPVVVNSGFLTVGSNNALGTGLLRLVGGTLRSSGVFSLSNVFSVEGPAQLGGENNLTLTGPGTIQDGATLTVTNRAQTTFSGPDNVLTGRGALTQDGGDSGILQILSGGTNAYKGGTRLTTGTLIVNKNSSLGDGPLTLSGGTLQATAAITLPNSFSVVGPLTVPGTPAIGGSNNIGFAGPGSLSAGTTLFVSNTSTTAVTTFLNILDGPGGLTVASAGRAVLSAANTYTGPTTVTVGTLQLAIANGIPSASAVTIADGGTLNLNNFNDTIASLASPLPPFTNAVPALILGSATLTTGTNNASTTFAGTISGTGGGLTKIGTGTLTLSAGPTSNNSYTGPTIVNAGTLVINDLQPLSAVTVSSGATLRGGGALARTGDITSTGGIISPGTATTTSLGSGKLTLDSASTFVTQLINRNIVNQLIVTGTVDLGNSTLRATLSFNPSIGDSFTLISRATSVTGTFNGLPEGTFLLIGGATFRITYVGVNGPNRHDVVLMRSTLTTTTTIVSSDNPSVFSQFVTFTAAVTPSAQISSAPTGLVTFRDGNIVLDTVPLDANGRATTRTSALLLGSHTITARYVGDGNFTASVSDPLTQVVNRAASVTVLTAVPNPAIFGQPVVLTATVAAVPPATDTPTGSVVFKDGSTILGTVNLNALTGQATLTTSQLSIGSHALTVDYSGDPNFTASSSAPATEIINKIPTVTALSSSANRALLGQSITITATVSVVPPSQGTPTGTVTFSDGSSPLATVALGSNGRATFSTAGLSLGSHTITAVYSGDALFSGSTSAPFTQAVQTTTTTVVTSSVNPSVTGQAVTFTASVSTVQGSGMPTGTFTFKDGATTLGTSVLDANDRATFTISALVLGPHSITAVYEGDSNFVSSTSPALIQTVSMPSTATLLASSVNPSITTVPVSFTATVTVVVPGVGASTGTVVFKDGATTLGTATLNSNGQATLTTDQLVVGTHTITATYGGDANVSASTSAALTQTVLQIATQTALSSSPNPAVSGQPVTLTATVTVVPPGKGTPTGTVNFIREDTGTLGTATLDASGQATFTTAALPVGTQGIVAAYVGDANFRASVSGSLQQTVNAGNFGLTQNQRFVVQLYRDLLQRDADPIGFAYYVGQLDQGKFDRVQVAAGFINSPEYQVLQVQNVYRSLLGRDADPSGLRTSLQLLTTGGTIERLRAIITGSQEYFQVRGGGSNNGFLDALFQDAFLRPVDASGRATYTQALGRGMNRIQVAEAIYGSPEYQEGLVHTFYMRYLHRIADPIGLNLSTASLRLGRHDELIILVIVSSAEYFSLV
jgi:autotransporter-associated beta strand protein